MTEEQFSKALGASANDHDAAIHVYRALAAYCVTNVLPNPDDDLEAFFGIDPDELEGIVEELFHAMDLPLPTPKTPEQIPTLGSAADLVGYLSARKAALTHG